MEATGNWQYLHECWEGLSKEIQMAHPLKTKAIASARRKTDRIDADILAHLAREDLIPQSYMPPREVRDLRELLRHRAFFVSLQTKVKNRIHSCLVKLGIEFSKTDLFGKAGMEWLKGLDIRQPFKRALKQDIKILEALKKEINEVTGELVKNARIDERAELILPIRGIREYTTMLVIRKTGPELNI